MTPLRIGFGYDIHPLVEGRPCILGGVRLPSKKGPAGHSDADVLLHAIADALLGAAALGDIGKHFPDTDPANQGLDSRELLRRTVSLLHDRGFSVVNVDATVVAEEPRLAPHIEKMTANIASDLRIDVKRTSVKATTHEKLGSLGRGEGIAAHAIALLEAKSS